MTTKTVKVAEATNTQLDWLVAKCEGYDVGFDAYGVMISRHQVTDRFDPSTNAGWMWPIIDREGIDVRLDRDRVFDPGEKVERWYASKPFDTIPDIEWIEYGPTGLIAAARCYVVSKLGETVEVPEELA